MRTYQTALAAVAMAAGLSAATTALAQNADRGADLFAENCSDCHSVSPAMKVKKGPPLHGVVGRRVASIGGFPYTPSLAQTGLVWTPANLDRYLANPKAVAPAGKMKFDGFAKAGDRADIIAYLAQQK